MHKLRWLSLYNNRLAGAFPLEVARLQALTHDVVQLNNCSHRFHRSCITRCVEERFALASLEKAHQLGLSLNRAALGVSAHCGDLVHAHPLHEPFEVEPPFEEGERR